MLGSVPLRLAVLLAAREQALTLVEAQRVDGHAGLLGKVLDSPPGVVAHVMTPLRKARETPFWQETLSDANRRWGSQRASGTEEREPDAEFQLFEHDLDR